MNCKVFVLALFVLIGSSCKHKPGTENTPTPQETPQPGTHHGSDEDDDDHDGRHHEHEHDDDDDDDHDKHHHGRKHHRLPPGQEKKLHGDRSARDYAPGHTER